MDLEPGSVITLGQYEQDGNTINGPEPIQWLVLATEENEALVVSTLGLDTFPYDSLQEKVVWENSSIRTWLSDTFYKNAFTAGEKQAIAEKTILQHINTGYPHCNQGNSTADPVFLLSTEEYISYLYNNEKIDPQYREGIPSDYVVDKGVNVYDYHEGPRSWWWLRTSSNYNDKACFVSAMGSKDVYVGYPINTSGGLKAKGHPLGATGISQIIEVVKQLRGEAEGRQVEGAKAGLCVNFGGFGNNVVATVLTKD